MPASIETMESISGHLIEELEDDMEVNDTLTCYGRVRGDCGHIHHSALAQLKCLYDDARGCKAQGGYSDREPCAV